MVRLLRILTVALLLYSAIPALVGPVSATTNAQNEIATLKKQVAELKVQRDLEKRLTAAETQLGQASRADARQANLIAILGIIITIFLFVLTLRAPREARDAARTVAINELTNARAEFTRLADEERKSVDESKERLAEVNARADEIRLLAASIKTMRDVADRHLSTIEAGAKAAEDAARNTTMDRQPKSEVTEEQKQKIIAAVAESAGQTEELWTVDQYKAAIGKALYADEDWQRGAELAQRLIDRHGADRDALRFGLEGLGRAEIGRRRWKEAHDVYATLAAIYEAAGETDTTDYCNAKHLQGYALTELGESGRAEALYRALLSIRESLDGNEALGTLATRHNLAYAILDQGRAAEAEKILHEILPLRERIEGPEASSTLATRNVLADAILEQGRADEAEVMYREILSHFTRANLGEASETITTRHALAISILEQGRSAEAEAMLREILPLRERVDGAEHSFTLTTRHALARAILNQGRAADAEAMLRELLPLRERVDGIEHSFTLVTRYCWADALLQSGDVASAVAALAPIHDPVPNSQWLPRWEAALAFVRARVAYALSDRANADAHLDRADAILTAHYPANHADRVKLAAYRANRAAGDSPDA